VWTTAVAILLDARRTRCHFTATIQWQWDGHGRLHTVRPRKLGGGKPCGRLRPSAI